MSPSENRSRHRPEVIPLGGIIGQHGDMTAPSETLTSDRLLGGRVIYQQPRLGFRASLDPVLLAAAIPAKAGERVLEGGSGAGAALLCLKARVPGVIGTGLERDAALAGLARGNAIANGWPDLTFVAADVAAPPIGGVFDHAFANPPYHPPDGTRSPRAAKDGAKRSSPDDLSIWVKTLADPLRHRGTLTFILPPSMLEPALAAFRGAMSPAELVIPVWPKKDQPARWLLIRGRKGGRTPLTMAPGLILHADTGEFRPEANRILREAGELPAQ